MVGETLDSPYPFPVIRELGTLPQRELLSRMVDVLADDDRVVAAWLVGSFALGTEDPFSDLDVHCLIEDDSLVELTEGWPKLVHRATDTVMIRPFSGGNVGGTCITPEWLHIDLVLHRRSMLDPRTVTGMAPLIDKAGVLPGSPVPRSLPPPSPFFPDDVVSWFFYMFGSLVIVSGRNEAAWAMNGVITMRDTALVPLMFAENGQGRVGGNKRLNPFLTPEQRQVLLDIPAIGPTLDSVIAAELAIARDFIPRGRRLARTVGGEWPTQMEDATVAFVERNLGVTVLP